MARLASNVNENSVSCCHDYVVARQADSVRGPRPMIVFNLSGHNHADVCQRVATYLMRAATRPELVSRYFLEIL